MFENIGGKIKTLAVVLTWIGIIGSCLLGLFLMAADEDTIPAGFLTIIFGSLSSWLSSLVLYGFGQLIENSDILVAQGNRKNTTYPNYANTGKHQWRCECGAMIDKYPCPGCGYTPQTNPVQVKMNRTANGNYVCPNCNSPLNGTENACGFCGQIFK